MCWFSGIMIFSFFGITAVLYIERRSSAKRLRDLQNNCNSAASLARLIRGKA